MKGPLSSADLKALAASGQLAPDSLVRQGTAGAWVKAARVKGLFQPSAASPTGSAKSGAAPQQDNAGLGDSDGLPDFAPGVLPVGQGASARSVGLSDPFAITERPRQQPAGDGASAEQPKMSQGRVLVVAIMALTFSFVGVCVGFLPILPVIMGVVGAILGVRGLLLSARVHKAALALASSAIILGIGAGAWGTYSTMQMKDPRAMLNRWFSKVVSGGAGSRASAHWNTAPDDIILAGDAGDLGFQVSDAVLQRFAAKEGGGSRVLLVVTVRLSNGPTQSVDFKSWNVQGNPELVPTLQDDAGNSYAQVSSITIPGQLQTLTIRPREIKLDKLVFDRPKGDYSHFDLTLPAEVIGESEPFLFRIPRTMVRDESGPPPASAEPKK